MNGWVRDLLGDHVEIVRGLSYTGAGLNSHGLPLHNLNSINEGGGYKREGIKFYSGPYRERHTVRPGDVIVANTDLTTHNRVVGYPALVPDSFGDIGLFSHHLYRVRPLPESQLDCRFLYHLLRARQYHASVSAYANGTTVNMLPPEALQRLVVALPPPDEQRAIVAALGALEDKVAVNARVNETVDALAQAIFDESLRTATRQAALADHLEVVRGLSYGGAGLGTGLPLHNLNSIREGGGYKREGLKSYSGAYRDRHTVRPGDVIVANTEQTHDQTLVGSPAIVPEGFGDIGLFSHHLYRVRVKPGSPLSASVTYLLLRSEPLRSKVIAYANGTTVTMLPAVALARPTFSLPADEQLRFVRERVEPLLAMIQANENENASLAALQDALLPALVSGALRISRSGQLT